MTHNILCSNKIVKVLILLTVRCVAVYCPPIKPLQLQPSVYIIPAMSMCRAQNKIKYVVKHKSAVGKLEAALI